jgi:Sec7-like guanine-nucleotide exchange factor
LDALIDQGEEKTVTDALIKHQSELSKKIEKLKDTALDRVSIALKQSTYGDFRSEISNFRNIVVSPSANGDTYAAYSPSHYMRSQHSSSGSPAVSGLKSDIRSLKAVLLNRRNFPTV